MRRLTNEFLFVCIIVALCGCGSGSTYKPQPPAEVESTTAKEGIDQNLMPFQVGNKWVLRQTTAPIEQTFQIAKVDKTAQGAQATFDVILNGKISGKLVWVATDKGIFQTAGGLQLKQFSSPKPLIVFPSDKGTTFSWSGTGPMPDGNIGPITTEGTVIGPEEIDTDAGRVSAICVVSKSVYKMSSGPAKGTTTIWFAPGVGMARYAQESGRETVVLTLKDKSLKR